MKKLWLCLFVSAGIGSYAAMASAQCVSDADCKGGRVCVGGSCIEPATASSPPATLAPLVTAAPMDAPTPAPLPPPAPALATPTVTAPLVAVESVPAGPEEGTFQHGYIVASASVWFGGFGVFYLTPKDESSDSSDSGIDSDSSDSGLSDNSSNDDVISGNSRVRFARGFHLAGYGVISKGFHLGAYFDHKKGYYTRIAVKIGSDTLEDQDWSGGNFHLSTVGLAMKLGSNVGKHVWLGAAIDVGPAFLKIENTDVDTHPGFNTRVSFAMDLLPDNVDPLRMTLSLNVGMDMFVSAGETVLNEKDQLVNLMFAPMIALGGGFGA